MKLKLKQCIALAALLGTASSYAQLPISRTGEIEFTDLTAGQFRFIAVTQTEEPLARNVATAVSTDDVTLAVPTGTFTGLSGQYAAQIIGGPHTGRVFEVDEAASSNQTVRLTGLAASGVSVIANSTEVQVVKKLTLDTAFPNGGSFKAGATPGGADLVYLGNGSGGFLIAYYKTAVGWVNSAGDVPVGSTPLPLNGSILVKAANTAPGKAVVKGVTPSGKQIASYAGNGQFTFIGSPYKTLVLNDLNSFVTAGTSPGASDLIYIVDGGVLRIVYRKSTDSTWRNSVGDTIISGTTNIGKGFMIKSKNPGTGGLIAFAETFAP